MSEIEQGPKKSNMTLWVMVLLFGLPYVVAMYFYMNSADLNLGEGSNYGHIVTPARPLPDMSFVTLEDKQFQFSSMRGKWILMSIGTSGCAQACQDNLYKLRQIRKAVGQDTKRIERIFFLTDNDDIAGFRKKLADYYGMTVIKKSGVQYSAFLSDFIHSDQHKIEDGLYIIDPLGNYMMAYPDDADPNKILKDVRRLLKVSQIG